MFDFDRTTDRSGTFSLKWDVARGELPMWVADMDLCTCPAVTEALEARARHGIFGYTVAQREWAEAYIGWWKRRHAFEMKEEWLQFATGVVPAISCLVKRLTNVGDNVVLMTPVYNIFFHSVENAGRHVLECPLRYEGGKYSLCTETLEAALADPLSTLLILCNPHNPTGQIWTREELLTIARLCEKYGVTVLSDEIHCDLTLPGKEYVPFASLPYEYASRSVTCLSPSKSFNLGGLQSAAVCVPDPHLRALVVRGLNSDEVAEPNCFAVTGTIAAFEKGAEWLDELRAYLAENRRIACEALRKTEIVPVEGEATYLLWLDCSALGGDSDVFCAFLRKETGLVLSEGSIFRGNGNRFLRMNLAYPKDVLLDGLARLERGAAAFAREEKFRQI